MAAHCKMHKALCRADPVLLEKCRLSSSLTHGLLVQGEAGVAALQVIVRGIFRLALVISLPSLLLLLQQGASEPCPHKLPSCVPSRRLNVFQCILYIILSSEMFCCRLNDTLPCFFCGFLILLPGHVCSCKHHFTSKSPT